MSSYFTPPAVVVNGTTAQASDVNDLSVATEAAFDTLAGTGISGPAIVAGDAYKALQVNVGETATEYVTTLRVDIAAADGTQILSNGTDGSDATFIGDVTGNADTATAADTVTTIDESADTACYIAYFNATTGDQAVKTGTNLTFNSSTGDLSSTRYTSTVATGTAPFTVASTTEVTNLNAATVGGADYETGTLVPGGDFTGGTIRWVRMGKLVTISFEGLTHASDASPFTTGGIIPAAIRPTVDTNNAHVAVNSLVQNVTVLASGTLGTQYFDWAGLSVATSASLSGSISYILA
jgi:hypothetical protein